MKKAISDEIKTKLRKILTLSESGIDGERLVAKQKLQDLLCEYGLTLEDLADDREEAFAFQHITNKQDEKLWAQVVFKVKATHKLSCSKRRGIYSTMCTKQQALEIADLYKWHRQNYKKELHKMQEDFLESYILKHGLFPTTPSDAQATEPVDLERLRRILMYQSQLSDDTYHKSLKA